MHDIYLAQDCRRMLAELDQAQAEIRRLIEEARHLAELRALAVETIIFSLAEHDAKKGNSSRGRAARIERQLRKAISRRHIQRILDKLQTMSSL